ncbi:hypothetical protein CXG81DRAFT_14931 [Caulochytrium protostelioides]|uniref:HCP-like protein n=1 Tax=Caulochytrium protostelioides TaxID=1555241 RepID=A0A4P9X021_9FUNG|nr:hypothetical protein CXG81DRAFT_14931 [Caulochytrium protostelioides]|eukprot:RKO99154.1 hypothetical protein CXG81DRAFT_14931 [Caulochytrium protostelioides]
MRHPVGLFLYAMSLRHGWGVRRNERAAVVLLQRAAERAVRDLMARTGSIGASGTAASHELGLAIYELAMSFRQGWGVAKDKASAMYYLQIAAQLGDVDAQMALGEAYLAGKGVRRDKRLAAKWFRSAERQGARMVSQQWIWKEKYDLV